MTDDKPQTSENGSRDTAPDLDAERWIVDLLYDHYANLYQLAFSVLGDESQARRQVFETFAATWTQAVHHHRHFDPLRLYEFTLSNIRPASKLPQAPAPPDELDARIWRLVDGFEPKERQLCVLSYLLDFSDHDAARVLKVSEEAVKNQLGIFQHRFQETIKGVSETVLSTRSGETAKTTARLTKLVSASLQARWPALDIPQEDLDKILIEVKQSSQKSVPAPSRRIPLLWFLLALGGALVILLGLAVSYLIRQISAAPESPPQTSPVTLAGFTTPRPSPRQVSPLTMFSSSETILNRLQESTQLWNTLWFDLQVIDYGSPSYYGAPRLYRLQSWISQPSQSIQISGLLGEEPSSVYLFKGWRGYYLNPLLAIAYSQESSARPETLLENQRLRRMVFPQTSIWATEPGVFQVVQTGTWAGRRTLVVDWTNSFGQRQARLWLDAQTGVILRQQEFGGDSFDILLAESSATEVLFDQSFPPARLVALLQQVGSSAPEKGQSEPAPPQVILPTPTTAVAFEKRASSSQALAPSGFDPSHSRLAFEFANDITVSNAVTGTAEFPVELLADGYRIGASKFGLPWMLRCDRSPDGLRLAYNTASDGASEPDNLLRWLDLRQPDTIYQPLPDLHALDFSFSGTGTRLAVFATGASLEQSGLYLIDIGTGESRLIRTISQASSLVWSPDEEFLTLIGIEEPGGEEEVMVIHVRTGQIAFRAAKDSLSEAIPADWPIANWGVDFPVEPGGMEECSKPPLD